MKPNKKNTSVYKNIIMCILISTVIFGGLYLIKYHQNVNSLINYSIYANLSETKYILNELDKDLLNLDNEKINKEEFTSILKSTSINVGYNIYTTKKYKQINKRLDYVDISMLNYYIKDLASQNITDANDLQIHKNNLIEICELWKETSVDISDNYFTPSAELKETLLATKKLSQKGYDQLYQEK
ncbi:MAG: hypothetical protein ACK5MV_12105 [Aminipila sp.]